MWYVGKIYQKICSFKKLSYIWVLALTLKTDTTDNKRAENDRQNANASQN